MIELGDDHQRVAGWLALTLQTDCALLDGPRAIYSISDNGAIDVRWQGGPTAAAVAEQLLDAANPDTPVVRPAPTRHITDDEAARSACVVVAGVRVLLTAVAPQPHRRVAFGPIGALPTIRAPRPLADDGHAADVVTWEIPLTPDETSIAIVTRVPTAYTESLDWSEDDTTVVDIDHTLPLGAHHTRRSQWTHARDHAAVRLRTATPDTTDTDADSWLDEFLKDPCGLQQCTAMVWRDRCLMHLKPGLRIDAAFSTPPHSLGVTSKVPAVVISALTHALCRAPIPRSSLTAANLAPMLPTDLNIRSFGHGLASDHYRVHLTTTITVTTEAHL